MITARGTTCEARRQGAIGTFSVFLVIGATDRDDTFDILRSHGYEPRNMHNRKSRIHQWWQHSYVNATDRDNYESPCRNQDPSTPTHRYNHNNRNTPVQSEK